MAGVSPFAMSQKSEERIDSYLKSREDFPLDYLSSLNISFTQKEQEFIAGAYMWFWLANSSTFDEDLQNPPFCKGTLFELWCLLQYCAVSVRPPEREQYRKRIDRICKGKISDDVWGQLMAQRAPMNREQLEPLTEEILKKISRSFLSFKPFQGVYDPLLSKSDKKNVCPILKAIRPFLRAFPLKTDYLMYAYPFLSQRKQDLSVSHTRLLVAQYITNVVYVSPEPVGTPMEIWFLLSISHTAGIISQQRALWTWDEATRCLGEVYKNPRNTEDHNYLLGWIDSSRIVDKIGLWKYHDFLEDAASAAASAARGMYVAHQSVVP